MTELLKVQPAQRFKTGVTPKPNRLIKVYGCDWADFTAHGVFVPYKPINGVPQKRNPRFCLRSNDGSFSVDRNTWKDSTEWEYVGEEETIVTL